MKVGIVAPEFPPELGGMQTYAYEFSRELARRGHQVTVFTRAHNEGEISEPGFRVVAGLRRRRRFDRLLFNKHRMDMWHVMNASYAWMAEEYEPVVVSVHGNDFLRPFNLVERLDLGTWRGLWRISGWLQGLDTTLGRWRTARTIARCLPKAHHIVANSQYTEAALLRRNPACRMKTSVGYVGVSEHFLAAHMRTESNPAPELLTVCRLSEPRKNVDVVLNALARLRGRHAFRYTVIGDGDKRTELERLANQLGLQEQVKFVGAVDGTTLLDKLRSADLFILTSSASRYTHEGFGIVYLEASACGVPVLAARVAGAAEAVKEGVSGMFVDRPTIENVAIQLERFLSGEARFDPKACRQYAEQFRWERIVTHILAHYPRVIDDGNDQRTEAVIS